MKMEVFFDYSCPYCYRGHNNLLELMAQYPALEVAWMPCEAHPRPEHQDPHSDVAIQGMWLVEELGGDLLRYHKAVYEAMFETHENIADPDVLAACASASGVDTDAFRKALAENRYAERVLEANRYAWGERGWQAVPSYYADGRSIGSNNGILVPKEELERFIKELG